jgi:DNA-binding NarL/FixJ family response regulator
VDTAERRICIWVVERVEGVVVLGLHLEVRAAALVADADGQLIGIREPEERDVDAVVGAVRQLSHGTDLRWGGVHGRSLTPLPSGVSAASVQIDVSVAGESITPAGPTIGAKAGVGFAFVAGSRIVVAEDDVLLREGIASLLDREGFDVVGAVGEPEALTNLVRETSPDLVIVDIRMPPTQTWEGLDAARAIRAECPQVGILLLSAHVEIETAIDLLEGGRGIGYLLKSRITRVADVVDALERIAAGGSVVDPALIQELVAQRRRDDPLEELTPRELEVLGLMAEGHSNGGIAARLFITEGAVEKHVRSILSKLRLPVGQDVHRRVLAVLTYLSAR